MSTTIVTDARRSMRDALHRLVSGADNWSQPSVAVFRNRLLDEVGSGARPLANLLIEAIERGVVDSLSRSSMSPVLWSAKSTPLVMRWVNDRFLQPGIARWAVEAWGCALGCIDMSQLTAAVDAPQPEPLTTQWPTRRPEPVAMSAAPTRATSRTLLVESPSMGIPAARRRSYVPPITSGTQGRVTVLQSCTMAPEYTATSSRAYAPTVADPGAFGQMVASAVLRLLDDGAYGDAWEVLGNNERRASARVLRDLRERVRRACTADNADLASRGQPTVVCP